MNDRRWAIELIDSPDGVVTLAVKDLIDIAGSVTTAGSRLLASYAKPAERNAPIIDSSIRAGAKIIGKANMTELAFGAQGINPWFGTPENPLSSDLIPGGSSSGSAVAVGWGIADVAYGTDTGGSIRIPATCCGILGLKTTRGRISTEGVYPLAQTLDTVGPMALSFAKLRLGFGWLTNDQSNNSNAFDTVQRIRTSGSKLIEKAIDEALSLGGLTINEISDPGLSTAWEIGGVIMGYEATLNNPQAVLEHHRIDPAIWARLKLSESRTEHDYLQARNDGASFASSISKKVVADGPLALATVPFEIPTIGNAYGRWLNVNTLPFNVAGLPAISFPLSTGFVENVAAEYELSSDSAQGRSKAGHLPISIQLVGEEGSEEALMSTAELILSRIS